MRFYLLLFLLMFPVSQAAAQTWDVTTGTTVEDVELRAAPSSTEVLAKIPKGNELAIGLCFHPGDWCAATWKGQKGFIDAAKVAGTSGGQTTLLKIIYSDYWNKLTGVALDSAQQSDNIIWAFGDDLTFGKGSSGPSATYPAVASDILGRKVENAGVVSQTSTEIAARLGATETRFRLKDDKIPPTGLAFITERNITPLTEHSASSMIGTLGGIRGELIRTQNGGYAFLRIQKGGQVRCVPNCTFFADEGELAKDRVTWIWAGRNGASEGHGVPSDIENMVKRISGGKYLVASIIAAEDDSPSTIKWIDETNTQLSQQYGEHFVDVRKALLEAGSGNTDDRASIEKGVTPKSLRSDRLLLNDQGYAIVARQFADATLRMGW